MKTIVLNNGTVLTVTKTDQGIVYKNNNIEMVSTTPISTTQLNTWLKTTSNKSIGYKGGLGGVVTKSPVWF
jgi:hypothetical protein